MPEFAAVEVDKEKGPRGATAGAFQARTSADLGPA